MHIFSMRVYWSYIVDYFAFKQRICLSIQLTFLVDFVFLQRKNVNYPHNVRVHSWEIFSRITAKWSFPRFLQTGRKSLSLKQADERLGYYFVNADVTNLQGKKKKNCLTGHIFWKMLVRCLISVRQSQICLVCEIYGRRDSTGQSDYSLCF